MAGRWKEWGSLPDGEKDGCEDPWMERTERKPMWLRTQRWWGAACEENVEVGPTSRRRALQIMEIIQAPVLSGVDIHR